MRIFIITPIYASTTQGSGATPVVHYFAKEWVRLGHEVHVYHTRARFPSFFYFLSRKYQHKLNTVFGSLVPTEIPTVTDYETEGVLVHRLAIKKYIPHSRYSKHTIRKIANILEARIQQIGTPDILIGHWHNPSLDIMMEMKRRIFIRTCIVLHDNTFMLEKYYGHNVMEFFKQIDVIGFRNRIAQSNFVSNYGQPQSSFIAYSGVSSAFLNAGLDFHPDFSRGVDSFVFVGSLIARKNPTCIIKALDSVYTDKPYYMTYIGDGDERKNIVSVQNRNSKGIISFIGRLSRDEIINHLKKSQVFVMISSGEVFGLVYLEAMSLGLITVGSKNEGIDGIIVDGQNGFLCNAGDHEDLASIFEHINKMSREELENMSQNAEDTAKDYSDMNAAKHYLNCII